MKKIIIYNNQDGLKDLFDKNKSFNIYTTHVSLYHGNIFDYIQSSKGDISLVSPGNSFGIMSGGFDLALNKYFNGEIEPIIQNKIKETGLLLTPTNFIKIPTNQFELDIEEVIYIPTMLTPSKIESGDTIPYLCTLSAISAWNRDSILLLPLFGVGTGQLDPVNVLTTMQKAIADYNNIDEYLSIQSTTKRSSQINHLDLVTLHNITN